jgi:hypothetical protein
MTMLPLRTGDAARLSNQSAQRIRQPGRRDNEIVSEPELIRERGVLRTPHLLKRAHCFGAAALDVKTT